MSESLSRMEAVVMGHLQDHGHAVAPRRVRHGAGTGDDDPAMKAEGQRRIISLFRRQKSLATDDIRADLAEQGPSRLLPPDLARPRPDGLPEWSPLRPRSCGVGALASCSLCPPASLLALSKRHMEIEFTSRWRFASTPNGESGLSWEPKVSKRPLTPEDMVPYDELDIPAAEKG